MKSFTALRKVGPSSWPRTQEAATEWSEHTDTRGNAAEEAEEWQTLAWSPQQGAGGAPGTLG